MHCLCAACDSLQDAAALACCCDSCGAAERGANNTHPQGQHAVLQCPGRSDAGVQRREQTAASVLKDTRKSPLRLCQRQRHRRVTARALKSRHWGSQTRRRARTPTLSAWCDYLTLFTTLGLLTAECPAAGIKTQSLLVSVILAKLARLAEKNCAP